MALSFLLSCPCLLDIKVCLKGVPLTARISGSAAPPQCPPHDRVYRVPRDTAGYFLRLSVLQLESQHG